jgi:hypothetical protein
MSSDTLTVTDTDCTNDSLVKLVAMGAVNWFVEVVVDNGNFVINSTASETTSFTYYLIK